MSKTVDDLKQVYLDAWCAAEGDAISAGIAAVVRTLRDELVPPEYSHLTNTEKGWLQFFNEILGDAGEKVAGGPTREDGWSVEQLGATSSHAVRSPATAYAPAVCVWIDQVKGMAWAGCSGRLRPIKSAVNGCPDCRLPITFSHTEAK